jgi:organic radical activating enzyme
VKESWNANTSSSSINQIVSTKNIQKQLWGEPLMWDMTLLTQTLKRKWTKVHIETSGLSANRDMGLDLFISKEKISYPQAVYDNAHELKVIIFNKHDFVFMKNKHKK